MVKDTKSPIFKIQKARSGLVFDHPFFGMIALRQTLREDPTCKTGWTDGMNLGFNPEWIEEQSLNKTKGFLAHEVLHPSFLHHTRRGGRDPGLWNDACDYTINPVLLEAGFELPDDGMLDPRFNDMTAEAVYSVLEKEEEKGGGSGGQGGCGEVRDAPGKDGQKATPAEVAQQEQEWKIAVAQAAQVAKKAGKLPGGLQRWVDEIINPKLDWREVLRRFVDQSAKNDYSWVPPNRRYIHMGLYLPSLRSNELPLIGLINDTSGSRTDTECSAEVAANLTAILEAYTATELVLLHVDTRVAEVERITKDDLPLVLSPRGGGGTSFVPGFQWFEDNEVQPVCVIYFTDLECNDYPNEPDYPVLWIKSGSPSSGSTPPFGEVLHLN